MPGGQKWERDQIWQYVWQGERFNVDSGVQMLKELCQLMQQYDPAKFDRLPDEFPQQRKRRFASSKEGQHEPHPIRGSTVWLDTNKNTAQKKRFALRLITHFGYSPVALEIRRTPRPVHH
jgi:hypothetical protein